MKHFIPPLQANDNEIELDFSIPILNLLQGQLRQDYNALLREARQHCPEMQPEKLETMLQRLMGIQLDPFLEGVAPDARRAHTHPQIAALFGSDPEIFSTKKDRIDEIRKFCLAAQDYAVEFLSKTLQGYSTSTDMQDDRAYLESRLKEAGCGEHVVRQAMKQYERDIRQMAIALNQSL